MVGYDGVTNYVHMVGAGHITYFLKKWRNLNRFQNQGWESYNQQVAAFWHHRTTKGGGKHCRSKIKPIARWLLRLMMWKTGEGDRFFQQMEHDRAAARCQRRNRTRNTETNESSTDDSSDSSSTSSTSDSEEST
jgi:hypothetical protein